MAALREGVRSPHCSEILPPWSPPLLTAVVSVASLHRGGAEEQISFCAGSLGWFGEDQMFRAWVNRDLEGENGVRRMQDF